MVLVLVRDGDRILLGRKKRGFGQGKWNGFGGKVEPGESIEAAARREFIEETSSDIRELRSVGQLSFTFADGQPELEMHVFAAAELIGEPQETDEMFPDWFKIDSIPFDEMWADDQYWLPLFLSDRRFVGSFHYADETTILHHSVIKLENCLADNGTQFCQLALAEINEADN